MRRTVLFAVVLLATIVLATIVVPAVGAVAGTPRCFGERATIVGTRGADVLRGTARADVIVGLGGDDVIKGLGGVDRICGGGGDDVLLGGGGNDWAIAGGSGNDRLSGGGGHDSTFWGLIGGEGDDAIVGGPGFDLVSFFFAADGVTVDLAAGTATGEGSDTLTGVEWIDGSNQSDVLIGDEGDDGFYGYGGDDEVNGRGGNDWVSYFFADAPVVVDLAAGAATGEGSDTLTGIEDVEGTRFADTLTGDAGSNLFWAREGDDVIDGGTGLDWISYFYARGPVTVDLATGTATGEGSDSLVSIEQVDGSSFGDTIVGDAGDNVLFGLQGDDSLDGAGGTDHLEGGPGTDTCTNGETVEACEA